MKGGRREEVSLRKPLTIWHIVSRAVSQMNRFNRAVGGRTQTAAATLHVFWGGFTTQKKIWRLMLCWNHCSRTCQIGFIYNHQPGKKNQKKTQRQNAPSVITETITHNKLVLMLVDSVFRPREWITAVRMKLTKKKKKKKKQHAEKSFNRWSTI